MAKIAYCWERGGGFGHIIGFLPVARHLVEKGHEVVYIVKDLMKSHVLVGQYGFRVFQAPLWQMKVKNLPEPVNYAETLFLFGYLSEDRLLDMVMGWKSLLESIVPDLILFDYAPTAFLASRSISTKRVHFGIGYCVPPRVDPMPALRPWTEPPLKRLQSSEKVALQCMNSVLDRTGAPYLKKFMDLFDCDESILATFPELDHYQGRDSGHYWGPYMSKDEGCGPEWPESGKKKKVFAYLKGGIKGIEEVLQALKELEADVLVYLTGLSSSHIERYQSESLRFSPEMVNLKKACAECDLVVCHAGHATVSRSLLEGVPLTVLPIHVEQLLIAKNIFRLGAGTMVDLYEKQPDYAGTLMQTLEDKSFTEKAGEFASRYADFDQEQQAIDIADRIEEVIRFRA